MSRIAIDYVQLKNNYTYVINKVNELIKIVEDIDADCKKICSEGCWDGALSSSFNSLRERMNVFAVQSIISFKETEDYKNLIINSFKELEKENSNKYS